VLLFTEKLRLAEALAALPVLADAVSRQQVLELLPARLRTAVRAYPTAGHDLFGLVRTMLEYPDGFAELFRALHTADGSSLALENARDIAIGLGLLPAPEAS
jgi:hypothetical protein